MIGLILTYINFFNLIDKTDVPKTMVKKSPSYVAYPPPQRPIQRRQHHLLSLAGSPVIGCPAIQRIVAGRTAIHRPEVIRLVPHAMHRAGQMAQHHRLRITVANPRNLQGTPLPPGRLPPRPAAKRA